MNFFRRFKPSEYLLLSGFAIIVFSFPLQVLLQFKFVILVGYFLIITFFLICPWRNKSFFKEIYLYRTVIICLVIAHFTYLEFILPIFNQNFIFKEFLRRAALFILPISFYAIGVYSRERRRLIQGLLGIVLLAGSFNVLYMVFDNYQKFIPRKVGFYAENSCEYVTRVNRKYLNDKNFEDVSGRCYTNNRSFGLYDSSSISGEMNLLGFIVGFFLFKKKKIIRFYFTVVWGLLIMLSMNFTSIFVFLLLCLFYILRLKKKFFIFKNSKLHFSLILIIVSFILLLGNLYIKNENFDFIASSYNYAFEILYNTEKYKESTYLLNVKNSLFFYISIIGRRNHIVFFGDGYSDSGFIAKGADLGFIESIYRFGLPLYLFYLISSIISFKHLFNHSSESTFGSRIELSLLIIASIFLMELHYSVYQAKSILPMLFFTIGFFPVLKKKDSKKTINES